ncbi:MAG: hypothetical protein JW861_13075 [Bacteroidales bacterium]|nr:hypothetical protein [Bacteroidales bacterium]
MELLRRNIASKFIPFLMIGIMGVMIVNNGLFIHTHKLEDGSVVTHAHPFDRSDDSLPGKAHHHSKVELVYFENIGILFFLIFTILGLFTLSEGKKLCDLPTPSFISAFQSIVRGRAPPVSQ